MKRFLWSELRGSGISDWFSRVGWSAIVFLVILANAVAPVSAQERYLPLGSTTRVWETYTHRIDPALGTLPGRATYPIAATTRADGRVAVLFPVGFSSGGPVHRLLMVFEINAAADPPWQLVEGPYVIEYPAPAADGDPEIWVQGALAEYTNDRYALLGYWQELKPGTGVVAHHYYFLTVPKDGGTPIILSTLQPMNPNTFGPGEMVYLPTDGADPECFVLANPNGGGRPGGFLVFNTSGTLRREIPPENLFLATEPGQCKYSSSLEALPNGDLVAIASDYQATSCPDWDHAVAVIFDRYGTYKGAWAFGGSVLADPWYPGGFNAMAVLPSGHLYVASILAAYYWDAGHSSPQYGNTQYHTYRHFLVEPPYAMGSPLLVTSRQDIDFGIARIGSSVGQVLTLKNLGAAEMQISEIAIEGAPDFHWKGPSSLSLVPSYGLTAVPGAEVSHDVEIIASAYGNRQATLRIECNDPTDSTRLVPLQAFGVPPTYGFTPLANLNAIIDPPHIVGNVQIAGDGANLLASVYVAEASPPHTRLLRVPLSRNGKAIGGLDSAHVETHVELDSIAGFDLVEGPQGTLWMGADQRTKAAFIQVLADGTVLETPLPIPGDIAPQAFCFLSGTNQMLVVRRYESQVHLLSLVPRQGGGFDLQYAAPIGLPGPSPITQILAWVENGKSYTLAQMSGDLWMTVAPVDAAPPGPDDMPVPVRIAYGLDLRDVVRDPVTGDLLLLQTDGQLIQFQGFLGMLDVSPPIHLAFSLKPARLSIIGESGRTVRVEMTDHLVSGAWVSLTEMVLNGQPQEIVDPSFDGSTNRFYRAVSTE